MGVPDPPVEEPLDPVDCGRRGSCLRGVILERCPAIPEEAACVAQCTRDTFRLLTVHGCRPSAGQPGTPLEGRLRFGDDGVEPVEQSETRVPESTQTFLELQPDLVRSPEPLPEMLEDLKQRPLDRGPYRKVLRRTGVSRTTMPCIQVSSSSFDEGSR